MPLLPKRETKKSEEQRASILDNAALLFWEKGYHSTSIKELARFCGFEPSNIYYYFKNKEEILYHVIMREVETLLQSIRHLENDGVMSPIERLRVLIVNHVNLLLGGGASSYRLLHDVELRSLLPKHRKKAIEARDTYDRILRKIIRAGIDNGDFAEINEKLAGFAIASMIVRSRIWFSPGGEKSLNEIADFTFKLVLKALRNDKGARKYRGLEKVIKDNSLGLSKENLRGNEGSF